MEDELFLPPIIRIFIKDAFSKFSTFVGVTVQKATIS